MPFLFAFLLLFNSLLFAEPPTIRVGMELEVPPKNFVHILHYFDIERFFNLTHIRTLRPYGFKEIPEDYLEDPSKYRTKSPEKCKEWDLFLARVVIESSLKNEKKLVLKPDCPPEIAKIFSSLNWGEDSSAMEFRDSSPYTDLKAWEANTEALIRLVHMDELENNPMKNLGKTRFHIHVSTLDGRDIRPVVRYLNLLSLMRFIEGGAGESALRDSYGFVPDIYTRGLVRMFDKNHFELRNHFFSPAGDVEYLNHLLSLSNDEAIKEISKEIHKRLPETKKVVLKHSRRANIRDNLLNLELLLKAVDPSFPFPSEELKELLRRDGRDVYMIIPSGLRRDLRAHPLRVWADQANDELGIKAVYFWERMGVYCSELFLSLLY